MNFFKSVLLAFVFAFHFVGFAEFTDASLSFGSKTTLSTLSKKQSFTMTVWNIYKGKGQGFEGEFTQLFKHSDFMLLQEAVLNKDQVQIFESREDSQWVMAKSWEMREGATGTVTLSSYRFHSPRGIKTVDTEPFSNTPKTSLMFKVPIRGSKKTLLVVNTHSINFTFNGPFITQLEDLSDLISKHSGPVIWAGDFNTWSGPRNFYLDEIVKSLKLSPVQFAGDSRNMILDHVFVRDVEVNGAAVLKEFSSSDHWPLYLNLTIKP